MDNFGHTSCNPNIVDIFGHTSCNPNIVDNCLYFDYMKYFEKLSCIFGLHEVFPNKLSTTFRFQEVFPNKLSLYLRSVNGPFQIISVTSACSSVWPDTIDARARKCPAIPCIFIHGKPRQSR